MSASDLTRPVVLFGLVPDFHQTLRSCIPLHGRSGRPALVVRLNPVGLKGEEMQEQGPMRRESVTKEILGQREERYE